MTDDRSTPSWAALDRMRHDLRDDAPTSVYSALTVEELRRALEAVQRGEPEPVDISATLRAAARRTRTPSRFASMSDEELKRELRIEVDKLRAEHAFHTNETRERK